MSKRLKKLFNISLATFLFLVLIGSAFAVSFLFGLFFVLGFVISIYSGEIKRKPFRPVLILIGGLIVRVALGRLQTTLPNYGLTLDFAVSILIILFVFLLGWKIKRS